MNIKQLGNLDRLGIFMSMACAIHCMLLPFLTLFSTLGVLSIIQSPRFEWGIVALTVGIASWSLGKGIRVHRNSLPLILAVLGFTCIGIGLFFFHRHPINTKGLFFFNKFPIKPQTSVEEVMYMFSGGILISLAHGLNWRLLKSDSCELTENPIEINEVQHKLAIRLKR